MVLSSASLLLAGLGPEAANAAVGGAPGLGPNPIWTVVPEDRGTYFGNAVATGDVNGDGYADVIVGAPNTDYNKSLEGLAFLYYGSPSGPAIDARWRAGSNRDGGFFGNSLAMGGDVNGDGYADLIVGSPEISQTGSGRAYLYLGSRFGLSEGPSWKAEGEHPNGRFGDAVAYAGDIDHDGFSDVIIGDSWFGANNFGDGQGKVYLFRGSAQGLSSTPSWTLEGDETGAQLGYSVASAGDVNNDGFADVIVGARSFTRPRAYVFLGSAQGLSPTPSVTLETDQPESSFGFAVAGAGDVNHDGYADVIVGAPYYSLGANEGRAFLFLGSPTGPSAIPALILTGTSHSEFGFSFAAADINSDGYSDVIVGSPSFDDSLGQSIGRTLLYLGSESGLATEPSWIATGSLNHDTFGLALSSADVNGDGSADVIVGAAYANNQNGRAFAFLGCGTSCDAENAPPDCSGAFPDPSEVWPPNNALVPVSIQGVTDPDGDPVTVTISSITQDEPLAAASGGNACFQSEGIGERSARIRAKRTMVGDGRVYHIGFIAEDGRGGRCTGTAQVCVPHDRDHSCHDSGRTFDSTVPCEPTSRTFVVNSIEDDHDALSGDGVCATTLGVCTLRAAINETNASRGGSLIAFDLPSGSIITLRNADLTMRNTTGLVTIQGPGSGELTVDANHDSRLLLIESGATVELSGLTLRNGYVNAGFRDFAGGIRNLGALRLRDCVLSGCYTDAGGGGLVNRGTAAVENTTIRGNEASMNGGGIRNSGALELTDCIIAGNRAEEEGGGLANYAGTVVMTRTLVDDNNSDRGGGIMTQGDFTLIDSTVSHNDAFDDAAGLTNKGTATILGSTFNANHNTDTGGAAIMNVGTMSIVNSTISGNSSLDSVGGILNYGYYSNATLTLLNSTVTGNSGRNWVGGLFNFTGSIFVRNSLVAGNLGDSQNAADDCGFYTRDSMALTAAAPGPIENGFNLIVEGAGCAFSSTDRTIDAASLPTILGPLHDNGGPTQTHALLESPGNPAVDGADPSGCTSFDGSPLRTDQRGEFRPFPAGGRCDVGSFELRSPGGFHPRAPGRRGRGKAPATPAVGARMP